MIRIKDWIDGKYDVYISLQEALIKYHQSPPEGWFQDIEKIVNKSIQITNEQEYSSFLSENNFC